jgi:uncharacterized phage protein (predicted DNA packaging)
LIVSLEEAKLYLRIDGNEEDALIEGFIRTAEELCQNILRFPISDLITIPETLKQAVLFGVVSLYEKREDADMKSTIDVMIRLIAPYRRELW